QGNSGRVDWLERGQTRSYKGRTPIESVGAVEAAPARWNNHWIFAARAKNGADPRGRLVAYNPAGGKQNEVWLDVRLRGSPAIEGNWCVVGDREGHVYLLDMSPGDDGAPKMTQVHRVALGSSIAVSPVLRDGVAYVATAEGVVAAFRIEEGKLLGNDKLRRNLNGKITAGPILHQNTLYCGTRGDAEGGAVVAVNAFNFDLEWEFRTTKPVNCLPVVHEGVVYIGADDGRLYALAER
ncbi:MAG: outer membrane protein assembly factor BamB family protein, partial [Planctomycetota bacterium]